MAPVLDRTGFMNSKRFTGIIPSTPRLWVSTGVAVLLFAVVFAPPGWRREALLPLGAFFLLITGAVLTLARPGGRPLVPPTSLLVGAGVFVLTMMVSIGVGSSATALGAGIQATWICLLGMGWWLAGEHRAVARLGQAGMLAAGTVGVISLTQLAGLDLWPRNDPFIHRIVGPFSNPNHLGSFCAFVLPLIGVGFLRSPTRTRAVMAGLTFAALILAGSRGAWVGALVATVMVAAWIVWAMDGDTRQQSVRRGLILAALWFVIAAALNGRPILRDTEGEVSVGDRIRQATDLVEAGSRQQDATLQHRLFLWSAAMKMAGDAAFFGVGPGGFPGAFQRDLPVLRQSALYQRLRPGQQQDQPRHAHNEVLHLVAERGLLGLLTLGFCLVVPLLAAIRSGLHWPNCLWYAGGLAAAAGALVHSLVSYPLHMPGTTLGLFLVLGIQARRTAPPERLSASHVDGVS